MKKIAECLLALIIAFALGRWVYYRGYNAALARETLDNPRVTVQAIRAAEVCAEKLETCQCPGP